MNKILAKRARPARATLPVRLEHLESRQLLASFTVTSVADSGPGSLRQAILSSNATPGAVNTISFAIPGPGVHTIIPASQIDEIQNPVVIDATTQPGYGGTPLLELDGANLPSTSAHDGLIVSGGSSVVRGLTIDRFSGYAIRLNRDGNTIAANFLGTDQTGTLALGNGAGGIAAFSRNNVIGGPAAADANLISANGGPGVILYLPSTQPSSNVVERNLIGTDITGTRDLGNVGPGVFVVSSSNLVGGSTASLGNTIAFNGGAGVQVGVGSFDSTSAKDRIAGNSIFSNAGLGIDLGGDGVTFNHPGGVGFGPNNSQNYPVLSSAYNSTGGTTIEGGLDAAPNTSYSVEFASSPLAGPTGFGQGKTILGTTIVMTDASGHADVTSTFAASVPPGQVVSATATDGSGNTSEFARSITVTPTAQSDLSLATFNPNPTPQAGVAQSYTFQVTNQGPSEATGVVATDTLPAGATFLFGNSSQGTVVSSNGVVTINLGSLASGATAQFTLNYSVAAPGPALNTVTVHADQGDPKPSNNTLTQNFLVSPAPPVDLSVFGSAAPATVQVGDVLTYTFVVSNQSSPNPGTGVRLTDVLPQGVTFVSAQSSQGTATFSNGVVTADLGTLNPFFNAVVTIAVRLTVPGSLTNSASVSGNETDSNSQNNQATVTTRVNPPPAIDLAVSGSATADVVQVGDLLTYTFVVTNQSTPNPATGVRLTDALPQGVTFVSATSSQGTATISNGVVTADIGIIGALFNAVVTIEVRPTAPGTLTNSASVNGVETDPNELNNQATVTTTVNPVPAVDLSVFGSAAPDVVQVGDVLTYTFVVSNQSPPNPGTGVRLTDALPQGRIVSAQSSQGTATFSNGVVTADLGTLNPFFNAVVTIAVRPTVPGSLTNSASVNGNEADPNSLNNQAVVLTTVNPAPAIDLGVIVTAAPQVAAVGNGYTYAVLVGNSGTAAATGVSLLERLPDAAAIVSIKPSQGTYTLVGRTLTVALGSIAAGAVAEVEIVVLPGAPGVIVDEAAVSADQPDFNVANNYSSLGTIVQADVTAPTVTYSKLTVAHNVITNVVLTFDKDLDATLAANPANYQILDLGSNGSASAKGPKVGLASVSYDPITRSVTLTPARGLSIGRFYKLVVNGEGVPGVTDKVGNVLDGTFNGLQNSIYTAVIGRGTVNRPVAVQTGVPAPQPTSAKASSHAKSVKAAKVVPVHTASKPAKAAAVPAKTASKKA